MELDKGDIMMSMRRYGNTRQINVSPDKGKTWGTSYSHSQLKSTACNGDFIRYTSVVDGYDKSRLLHSLPYNPSSNERINVSVMMSYDEGKTYPVRKTICPGKSAYSALTILPDGTIGCYYEDGHENMDMVFVRFSLDWLSDGQDEFVATSIQEAQANELKVWVDNGVIKTNQTNDNIQIYNIAGIKMVNHAKQKRGTYLVKYNNITKVIIVK